MQDDEIAIRALVKAWLDATHAGDVNTLMSLMTDDVVFMVPGQPPLEGRDAYREALEAMLANGAIEASNEIDEIAVFGDIAYCRSRLRVVVTTRHGDLPIERRGHGLSILRRGEDGAWRMARDASMLGNSA